MKKLKLIMAIIAILVFSNLIFAANPVSENMQSIVEDIFKYLTKDITLSNSQQIALREKTNVYVLKLQNVNELTDSVSKINLKKQIFIDIKLSCDSILTSEQIELIRLKQIENREKMIK